MSTPLFRRKVLHAALLAIPAFALSIDALAADVPQVKITVNDKQCEPMQLTVPAGKTQFVVHNTSQKNVEWEILKGVMVVEERENIAPGFTQKMTANLEAGEYDMTCGLLSNPKGKLIVTAVRLPTANLTRWIWLGRLPSTRFTSLKKWKGWSSRPSCSPTR
ncbi:Iron uptake system component EfeO precursor [Serratia plymuthica]|uniref:Iron uptake system component EfeO n=1 Tax=Serratia plymuthica TaxID=82996 RepID=A0A2X4V6M4_SERPL|nr:Iron uptake system component EfeO precursor [Serratia plymuthica]